MLTTRATIPFGILSALCALGCSVEESGLLRDTDDVQEPPGGNGEPDGAPSVAEPAADAGPGSAPGAGSVGNDAGASCATAGRYALEIEADVHWEGTTLFGIVPIILPDTGKVKILTLVDLRSQGASFGAEVRACHVETPDFASSVGERYGVTFDDTLWDRVDTRWGSLVRTSCAGAGCTLDSDLVNAQLGMVLPDGMTWPSPRDPLPPATLRDDDKDGAPGILVDARGPGDGPQYQYPPSSYLLLERFRELMLAIRVQARLNGAFESCDAASGQISGMTIDTRAVGCRTTSGANCRPEQLDFLDDNLPVWKVDAARFRAARLAPNTGCADARATML